MGDHPKAKPPESNKPNQGATGSSDHSRRQLERCLAPGVLLAGALLIALIIASELVKQPRTATLLGLTGFSVLAVVLVALAMAAWRGLQPPQRDHGAP